MFFLHCECCQPVDPMCKLRVYTINICSNTSHCFCVPRGLEMTLSNSFSVQTIQELHTFDRISFATNCQMFWKEPTLQHPDEDVSFHTPVTVTVSEPTMICTTRRDIECELNYKCHVVNKTFSSQFTSDCHIYYPHNCHTSLHLLT